MYGYRTVLVIVVLIISGCHQERVNQIAPKICLTQGSGIKSVEISGNHIKHFSNQFLLTDAGHYLTGVYQTGANEIICTSVYNGSKRDSLLVALSSNGREIKSFGTKFDWFETEERLVLVSSEDLIIIDYPESASEMILPKSGESKFFKLCE